MGKTGAAALIAAAVLTALGAARFTLGSRLERAAPAHAADAVYDGRVVSVTAAVST